MNAIQMHMCIDHERINQEGLHSSMHRVPALPG
jgi:hypothetical protein